MIQERIKQRVALIKLPNSYLDEDRGLKECCVSELVLANGSSNSWENDITPVWVKKSALSDVVSIQIFKCDDLVGYIPTVQQAPNEPLGVFWEVHWKDVLLAHGVGIYDIKLNYSIAGITSMVHWGRYELKPFSMGIANGTFRLSAIFNHYHERDDFNFRGCSMRGTIRGAGFFGFRQPNKEIDNLIYSNREWKSVVRENLNTYELKTDPLTVNLTRQIVDLYLLSEIELFASDYNDFNHSYEYLDFPVILKETDSLEYKEYNRLANISAVFQDKKSNQRTFYV